MAQRRSEPAKRATVADLLGKPRRTREVKLGDSVIVFGAIGSKAYDDLVAKHPPDKGDKEASWNGETFPPALIAASSVDPVIDEDTAVQLWESDSWSRGELMDLFTGVVKLNVEGLNTPFGDSA